MSIKTPSGSPERNRESVRPTDTTTDTAIATEMQQRSQDHAVERLLEAETLESLDRERQERLDRDITSSFLEADGRSQRMLGTRVRDGAREDLHTLLDVARWELERHRDALANPELRAAAQREILNAFVAAIHRTRGEAVRMDASGPQPETIHCSEGADLLVALAQRVPEAGLTPEYAGTVGHVGNFTRIGEGEHARIFFSDVNGGVDDVTDAVAIDDRVSAADPKKGIRIYRSTTGLGIGPHAPQALFFSATRVMDGVHTPAPDDQRRATLAGNRTGMLQIAAGSFEHDTTLREAGAKLRGELQRSAQRYFAAHGVAASESAAPAELAARKASEWDAHFERLRASAAPGVVEFEQSDAYAREKLASSAEHALSRAKDDLPFLATIDRAQTLLVIKELVHYASAPAAQLPPLLTQLMDRWTAGNPERREAAVRAFALVQQSLPRVWSREIITSPEARERYLAQKLRDMRTSPQTS